MADSRYCWPTARISPLPSPEGLTWGPLFLVRGVRTRSSETLTEFMSSLIQPQRRTLGEDTFT
eukprot:15459001-Alexandrium_andersonii.AAC.1